MNHTTYAPKIRIMDIIDSLDPTYIPEKIIIEEPFYQEIELVKTECNYGGWRWWFVCEGCKRNNHSMIISEYSCRCLKCI